ncbi:MAG: hypothetical protein P8H98_03960, partial [Flavobacteriales bacterium]|nr:hypothetical protein [Flavobacteriales bacterium]
RAKAKAKEQEKENVIDYLADKAADASYTRKQNKENGEAQDVQLTRIYRDGEMNRQDKLSETERLKEKQLEKTADDAESATARRNDADQDLEELEIEAEKLSRNDRFLCFVFLCNWHLQLYLLDNQSHFLFLVPWLWP